MTIPFLQVKPRAIKLKVSPRFPAQLFGGTGIDVVKSNGNYTVNLDYSEFPPVGALPAGSYALVYDPVAKTYVLVPSSAMGGGGGPLPATATPLIESGTGAVGVSLNYAREDHVHPASGVPEAPNDGQLYGRKSLGWSVVPSGGGGGTTVYVSDTAPVGAPDNSLWWQSSTGILFLRFNDGDSTQWVVAVAVADASTYAVRYDAAQALTAAQQKQARDNISAVLHGYLFGLTLSTAGSSVLFAVAAGVAADSTNSVKMALAAALTKTMASNWSVGNNGGALDTGSTAAAWYHIHLIQRPDTGVVDVLASLSPTAPTLPANYTLFRRIGAMKFTGSAWVKFIQDGDTFMWDVPVSEVNAANPGTAAVTRTLAGVPTGVRVRARLSAGGSASTNDPGPNAIYISDLGLSDQVAAQAGTVSFQVTAGSASGGFLAIMGQVPVMTNTSAQIRTRVQSSSANCFIVINTNGWDDTRGRLG